MEAGFSGRDAAPSSLKGKAMPRSCHAHGCFQGHGCPQQLHSWRIRAPTRRQRSCLTVNTAAQEAVAEPVRTERQHIQQLLNR